MAVNGAANGASGANESSGPTRTVLVTEGAGYIGSHAVLQLLAAGFRAVVVDSLENSSELAVRRVAALSGEHARNLSFHKVDIRDEDALDAVFASTRFDAVIHFAGLKAVGESVHKPLFYYDHNIAGTINLLKVMAAHEYKKVDIRDEDALDAVFASTRFDAVIHFAGLKAVGESVHKPLFYYDHNIAGTINLLKVMAAHEYKKVDIRDEDALDAVFASTRFDAVIHFAGLKAVGESVHKPLFYYDHNIAGTINLLKVMAAHEYKKVLTSDVSTRYLVLSDPICTNCLN